MNAPQSQLDSRSAAAGSGRWSNNPAGDRHSRRLTGWQVCAIVLLVLALHCLGMHWIVSCWPGGEAGIARAQSVSASSARNPPAFQADDGWRRTASGWEQINRPASTRAIRAPSQHVQLVQAWPAAAAAFMVLAMLGFATQFDAEKVGRD